MRRLVVGLVMGLVPGSAIAAGAHKVMQGTDYAALGHDDRVLYLQGVADGAVTMSLLAGMVSTMGTDPAQLAVKVSNCVAAMPTAQLVSTLAAGATSSKTAADGAINALAQACKR